MGFYTRRGDDGYTGILGEGRLPKYHPILDAVGTVDEASAVLGFARSNCHTEGVNQLVKEIQRDLYHLMAELSASPENAERFHYVNAERVAWLEMNIDRFGERIEMPDGFILAGESKSSAAFALARTVVRRAERSVSRLVLEGLVGNVYVLKYLNRLSSFCFLIELIENQTAGIHAATLASKR